MMKIFFVFTGLSFFLLLCGEVGTSTCGYEACPRGKEDMLNVHIICHTHDDVGWLHTVDTYYEMWVKDIISSVVSNLVQDENRKFIYVETAFFSKWWSQQTALVKDYVRRLVNDGRLEFASGGWSMNDEATTHYLGVIDQMTLGLRWLNDSFGHCATPRVGWQVDTFGHSREQASLFAQMYFDGQFIGRVHYQDKFWRKKTKTMEVIWQASPSLGEKAHLFTGVLPNVYWPPKGFCFDVFCADEELTEDNIHLKGHKFISIVEEQAKQYSTNHIAVTMGMDFHFRDAAKWYRNLDFLIQHINSLQAVGIKVNVFYSSPACYLYSLNNVNMTWPTMTTDFFPYASKQHEYWTGYFTSRPSLKYHARKCSAFLQVCKQLVTLSNSETADIIILSEALGIVQHHDGITGTEKQHVANDYMQHLSKGYVLCEDVIARSLKKLMTVSEVDSSHIFPELHFCSHSNISQCQFTELETEYFAVIYNPLGSYVNTFVRIPVLGEGYNITRISAAGYIPSQVISIPPSVLNLAERSSLARNELVFPVSLPPLGVSIYNVHTLQGYEPVNDVYSGRIATSVQDAVIGNEYFQVKIDGYSGLMKEVVILPSTTRVPLKQSFYYYEGMPGYRVERASGAYAFNPQYDLAFPLGENVTYRVFKGLLLEEVHQYFTPWISQVIRIYKGKSYIEFDWVVGPVPVHDHIGREIISRFDSDLNSNGSFFTDANGRETIKRIRDFQENFPWNVTEHIAGNYYPVTSWIGIQDEFQDLQLSILTDRAQGGSSITDGSIELMVHRRLLFDDGYGVNEALNEPGWDGRGLIVRGCHYLSLGPIKKMIQFNKLLAKRLFHSPVVAFVKNNSSISSFSPVEFQGLTMELPRNIHMLTLEKLDSDRILLRLEHFIEKADTPGLSKPVPVSLSDLFTPFEVVYFQETTLAANKYLYEVDRLKWSFVTQRDDNENELNATYTEQSNAESPTFEYRRNSTSPYQDKHDELLVYLNPMEIRTFIVKIVYRNL